MCMSSIEGAAAVAYKCEFAIIDQSSSNHSEIGILVELGLGKPMALIHDATKSVASVIVNKKTSVPNK